MKRFIALVFALAVAIFHVDALAGCPDAASFTGYCVICGTENSYYGYLSVGTNCDYCGPVCIRSLTDTASKATCAGDPSLMKKELERRLQYVIDVDARTLDQIAAVNPIAAVWLARQSPSLSQIAKGNEVNIEDGNSLSGSVPTMDTVRLIAAGVGDADTEALAPTFTTPPSGQVLQTRYTSTKQSDGTIQVRFESTLIIPQDKTTVAQLYRPMTFTLGPSSRELNVTVPGRPNENLRAYPVVSWSIQTAPRVFRMQE